MVGSNRSGSSDYTPRGTEKSRLRFTEPARTMEELLSLGEKSAQLLNNPIYVIAHKSAIAEIQDEIIQTRPEEKNRRESLYLEAQALSRGVHRLNAMLNEAQQINLQMQQQEAAAQQSEAASRYGEPSM